MCGILVVLSKKDELNITLCDKALDKLRLRGPDFSFKELYCNNCLYFGQTVLSVTGNPINLIESYHKSISGRFDIVLNGETYNHKELFNLYLKDKGYLSRSGSDTETLVNLHDVKSAKDVFNELKGMFAYVIYDKLQEKLIIGRDIIGEKIIYFYEDNDLMIIASEIGPIIELKPSIKINKNVSREYFFTRHLLAPINTTFEGVKLVQSGHLLEYNLNKLSFKTLCVRKPADLIDQDIVERNKCRTENDLIDELESVFISNSKALTPPSINYYSAFSGGIDSSLVSMFVNEYKPPKDFIALQFPGKDCVSQCLTGFERKLGRLITRLTVNKELFASLYNECYKAACGPLSTHSFVSHAIMSKHVKDNDVKVLIGGDGADELFGGYDYYKSLGVYTEYPDTNPSVYSGYAPLSVEFQGWVPDNLMQVINERWEEHSSYYEFEKNPVERMLQTVLYSDTIIQLESVGIRAADTMSMVNSVEARLFYLSQDMIKFALNLPAYYKIDLNCDDELMKTKPILKKLFIRRFGRELLFPKQGFSGYPNESAKLLLGGDYKLVTETLGMVNYPNYSNNIPKALEWKLMNTELFFEKFRNFL